MSKSKASKLEKTLTEVELEMMNIVWQKGECTIKEVHTALQTERELAYTSVATIINILEQKKILKSKKREKAHLYQPLVSRTEYEALSLRHLAQKVFQGEPTMMVMRLLDATDLSQKELEAIRKIVNERLETK